MAYNLLITTSLRNLHYSGGLSSSVAGFDSIEEAEAVMERLELGAGYLAYRVVPLWDHAVREDMKRLGSI